MQVKRVVLLELGLARHGAAGLDVRQLLAHVAGEAAAHLAAAHAVRDALPRGQLLARVEDLAHIHQVAHVGDEGLRNNAAAVRACTLQWRKGGLRG